MIQKLCRSLAAEYSKKQIRPLKCFRPQIAHFSGQQRPRVRTVCAPRLRFLLYADRHVPGIGNVDQRSDLLLDGADDALRAMSEQIAAPAGEEVKVAVAFGVPDERTLAADEVDGVAVVVGDNIALEKIDCF